MASTISGVTDYLADSDDHAITQLRAIVDNLGIPRAAAPGSARRLADTEKARRLLGFEAKVGLDEGLRGLVTWWQAEKQRQPQTA